MPIQPDDISLNKGAVIERCIRAIHEYQQLDLSVLRYIAEQGYQDLVDFAAQLGVRIFA